MRRSCEEREHAPYASAVLHEYVCGVSGISSFGSGSNDAVSATRQYPGRNVLYFGWGGVSCTRHLSSSLGYVTTDGGIYVRRYDSLFMM